MHDEKGEKWKGAKVEQWLAAARDGSRKLATQLLKENPKLITAVDDTYQRTALHWATYYCQLKMVEFLLKEHVELITAVDAEEKTALHLAASNDQRALAVPLLLSAQLDKPLSSLDAELLAQVFASNPSLVSRVINSEGATILHLAAERDNRTIVEQLLAVNPQLTKTDFQGRTAFDVVVTKKNWRVIPYFLAEDPTLSSKVDLRGGTVLHCVVQHGYAKGVARLLDQFPEMINAVDKEGRTALHVAALNGDYGIMAQLLAVASPRVINAVCKRGYSALHYCAGFSTMLNYDNKDCDYEDAFAKLLDMTSHNLVNGVDSHGKTVLYWAARNGLAKAVARLLAVSPGLIDQVTDEGETVLHAGARYEPIAEMLLAIRPEMVHAVDKQGNTILHMTIRPLARVSRTLEQLMVSIPNAVRAVNSENDTPFHLAVQRLRVFGSPTEEVKVYPILVMLVKLSLEEAASAFMKYDVDHYKEEFLLPVLRKQCESLLGVLRQDVVGVVFEYLGFEDSLKRQNKRCSLLTGRRGGRKKQTL